MKKAGLLYTLLQIALWGIYGVLYSYANRYLLARGLSSTLTGVLLAAATGCALILQPLLTSVIDRKKLKLRTSVVTLSALMLLCSLILIILKSPTATAVIFAIAYIGVIAYPAFINALGMVTVKSGLRVSFAAARGIGALTFGITAAGTNRLIITFGEDIIPVLSLIFCALGVIGALMFSKSSETLIKNETPSKFKDFFHRNKRFCALLLSVAILNIGHNILGNCMYQIALFKGNGNAQGTVLMLSTFIEIPTILLFTKLMKIADSSAYMKISGVFFTLRIALTLLLPSIVGLYIAQLCQIGGYALYTVCSVYYASEAVCDCDTVKGQTYICTANTVGCLAAHLWAGAMIDALGVEKMLIMTMLLSVLGTVGIFFSTEKNKNRK